MLFTTLRVNIRIIPPPPQPPQEPPEPLQFVHWPPFAQFADIVHPVKSKDLAWIINIHPPLHHIQDTWLEYCFQFQPPAQQYFVKSHWLPAQVPPVDGAYDTQAFVVSVFIALYHLVAVSHHIPVAVRVPPLITNLWHRITAMLPLESGQEKLRVHPVIVSVV